MNMKDDIEPLPPAHLWHERVFSSMKIKCCMRCGFIENQDKPNKPCPGYVFVTTRAPGDQA